MTIAKFKNGKVDISQNKGSQFCPDCHKLFVKIDHNNVCHDHIFEVGYCKHCNQLYDITYVRIWESTIKVSNKEENEKLTE